MSNESTVISQTRQWFWKLVLEKNTCLFKREKLICSVRTVFYLIFLWITKRKCRMRQTGYYAKAKVFRIGLECKMYLWNMRHIYITDVIHISSYVIYMRYIANVVHSVVSYNPSLFVSLDCAVFGPGTIPPFSISTASQGTPRSVKGCCCLVPGHWRVFSHTKKGHTGSCCINIAFASATTRQEMHGSVSCEQGLPRAGSWLVRMPSSRAPLSMGLGLIASPLQEPSVEAFLHL